MNIIRYIVYYRRKKGIRRNLRTGTHVKPDGVSDREFRLDLLKEYLRTNKRVVSIEFLGVSNDNTQS
jgi:hypothetical protein